MASPWVLELEALKLVRGNRTVLHSVDARFRRGAVTAIVGPSGAGKTSLLRCLNRLEEPEEGRVLLDGEDIIAIDPTVLRKRVGMIFQTPVIFEGGVRANLAYGLGQADEEAMATALDAAGLPASFLQRDSTALSVGQAQRVCIARALMHRPEVLLMDEPTSALDPDAARRIEELVRGLSGRGLSVVIVTHNLAQASNVASEALLLVDGRVEARGTVTEVTEAWPREESS